VCFCRCLADECSNETASARGWSPPSTIVSVNMSPPPSRRRRQLSRGHMTSLVRARSLTPPSPGLVVSSNNRASFGPIGYCDQLDLSQRSCSLNVSSRSRSRSLRPADLKVSTKQPPTLIGLPKVLRSPTAPPQNAFINEKCRRINFPRIDLSPSSSNSDAGDKARGSSEFSTHETSGRKSHGEQTIFADKSNLISSDDFNDRGLWC
jgi:hypothetical protein